MAKRFYIRAVCETEIGDQKGWHFYRYQSEGDSPDMTQACSEHTAAAHRDHVVESEEAI